MRYDDTPVFGKRVLIPSHNSPDTSSYRLWLDLVPLFNSDYYVLDSFNFEPRSNIV